MVCYDHPTTQKLRYFLFFGYYPSSGFFTKFAPSSRVAKMRTEQNISIEFEFVKLI